MESIFPDVGSDRRGRDSGVGSPVSDSAQSQIARSVAPLPLAGVGQDWGSGARGSEDSVNCASGFGGFLLAVRL